MNNYSQYRGKCKELSEAAIVANPTLTLVRGHYDCPIWGLQAHWWCTWPDGRVFDPSAKQFPSGGLGKYIPFDGNLKCCQCGKEIKEEDAIKHGNYGACSTLCMMRFVGL